jgi:ADP-ribose pyrophosphatase YjhB (NUDIX family)
MRTNKRVSAIVIKNDKLLLIHRFKNGDEYWVVPGGGVEDEETLNEALIREVKEETSLDLLSSKQVGSFEQPEHQHYFFKCVLQKGEPSIGGPEKDNSTKDNVYILEWVPVSKVKTLTNLFPESIKEFL